MIRLRINSTLVLWTCLSAASAKTDETVRRGGWGGVEGARQIVATFCGSCSAHCVDILASVSPSIRLSVSKSISQSVNLYISQSIIASVNADWGLFCRRLTKSLRTLLLKALTCFKIRGNCAWDWGDWKEAGEEKNKEIRSRRDEGGERRKEGGLSCGCLVEGGREEPSYLRCLRLAALGCLRFLSGKQQEVEKLAGSKGVCVCVCVERGGAKSFVS